MLKTYDFQSFIQRPHFSQNAKNLFWASFLTHSDIAAYNIPTLHLHIIIFPPPAQVELAALFLVAEKKLSDEAKNDSILCKKNLGNQTVTFLEPYAGRLETAPKKTPKNGYFWVFLVKI